MTNKKEEAFMTEKERDQMYQIANEHLSILLKMCKLYELEQFAININQKAVLIEVNSLFTSKYIFLRKEFKIQLEKIFEKYNSMETTEKKEFINKIMELYSLIYNR